MLQNIVLIFILLILGGCSADAIDEEVNMEDKQDYKKATFAGGCFWCTEAAFQELDGVIDAVSGYTGGVKKNPAYEEVSKGNTGHLEAVEIIYDPKIISYEELLKLYFRTIDPTDDKGQFHDKGSQYKTAIFYHDEEQKEIANKTIEDIEKSKRFDKPIVTKILKSVPFYKAEEYHQDYYKKRTLSYQIYKKASGREKYKKETWT